MATYFLWGSIGLIVLALLIGFLVGVYRGLKRSATHILFVVASVIIAFFVTSPITDAILNVNIDYNGATMSIKDYIVQVISENFVDLSHFDSASEFIKQLPSAVMSPIVFIVVMVLMFLLFEIIYLIVARISFGSKKKDFSSNKPRRIPGGLIAMAETFMFLLVLFAPITSLTQTYEELVSASTAQGASTSETSSMPTIGEQLSSSLPVEVNEAILSFNDSAFGVICSAGGFDDALFDGLSDVKIDGEKINVREEILNFASTYDEVAVFVNSVNANNFSNLNFTPLKDSLNAIINNNLFKTVITDTLKDFIVNYDTLAEELNLSESIPQEVTDIIHDLQPKMTDEFDFYEYLSSDLLNVLDIADNVIKSGTLEAFMQLEDADVESILNIIVTKKDTVAPALKTALNLNLVTDTLPRLIDMLAEMLQNAFENNPDLSLNGNLTEADKNEMVDAIMNAAEEIKTFSDNGNDIFGLLSDDNMISALLDMPDLGEIIDSLGEILDDVSGLKIFSTTNGTETVNAFQTIIEGMGLTLLGDEVSVVDASGEVTTKEIASYSDFFAQIKGPILAIKNTNGLSDMISGGDFSELLDVVKAKAQEDEEFIADILMPFYELETASVNGTSFKEMIFDNVTSELSSGMSSFITLNSTSYADYRTDLISLGSLIKELASGTIEVEEDSETVTYDYFDYLTSGNADLFTLITDMLNTSVTTDVTALDNVLNILFANDMYAPLNDTIFTTFDEQIVSITNIDPKTNFANLYDSSATNRYISTIKALLNAVTNDAMSGEDMSAKLPIIGEMLDSLKGSAQEGVFYEAFENIIWYLTGDVINSENTAKYASGTPYMNGEEETYKRIKEYLAVEDVANGYYNINYTDTMNELVSVLELADALSTLNLNISGEGPEVIRSNIQTFVDNFEAELEKLYEVDAESGLTENGKIEATNVITNASNLTNEILTAEQISEYGEAIVEVIDSTFGGESEVDQNLANAIKNLLGLSNVTVDTSEAESGI